jgi:hypothetical protein
MIVKTLLVRLQIVQIEKISSTNIFYLTYQKNLNDIFSSLN